MEPEGIDLLKLGLVLDLLGLVEGWQILVLGSVELLLQVVEVDHRLLVELLVT